MANWVAKVDLTLIVDEQAGLTPTVSFVDLRTNERWLLRPSSGEQFRQGLGHLRRRAQGSRQCATSHRVTRGRLRATPG